MKEARQYCCWWGSGWANSQMLTRKEAFEMAEAKHKELGHGVCITRHAEGSQIHCKYGFPCDAGEKLKPVKLGIAQRTVLKCLKEYGSWPGGWTYASPSQTVSILRRLEAKGLVGRGTWCERPVYQLTDAGRETLVLLNCENG